LERANEAVKEAEILLQNNYLNTYVNRLYYACFYAVTSLLLTKNLSSTKHSGVRMLFHLNYVKTSIVEMKLGQLYDKLFRNRQKGDYTDFARFSGVEVKPWLEETKQFVRCIEKIVHEKIKLQNDTQP